MGRPFAAFDIDGTLIRWQLYHAVADQLAKQAFIDATAFQQVRQARMTWKTRAGERSYDDYEQALVHLIGQAIIKIPVKDFEAACRMVIEEYKDQVYTYTRDLIEELRTKDYLLFAVSGSQVEIVRLLADYYGFDDCGGTVYEVKQGRFTGKADPLRDTRKTDCLKSLVAKHAASWQGSIALGDSESDIPMLSSVERPIAFNPSKALFDHARANDWSVIVERKNMIYRLEPKDGSFVLA